MGNTCCTYEISTSNGTTATPTGHSAKLDDLIFAHPKMGQCLNHGSVFRSPHLEQQTL